MNSDWIIDGGVLVISLSTLVGLTFAGTLYKLGRELSEFLESDPWSSPQLVPARSSSYDRTHPGRHLTLVKPLR